MSDSSEIKYCSLCDQYFLTKELLFQHMQSSTCHPHCKTCKRSFLNMNSLRNHYVYSSRHHYCRACEKTFKTASGLRVHLEHASIHRDDTDDEGDDEVYDSEERSEGWEDALGQLEDQRALVNQDEEEISFEPEHHNKLPIAAAPIHARTSPAPILQQSCPICMSAPKTVSATRCGHLFCTPCIQRVFQESRPCPTCRKPGVLAQLRKIDLHVY